MTVEPQRTKLETTMIMKAPSQSGSNRNNGLSPMRDDDNRFYDSETPAHSEQN